MALTASEIDVHVGQRIRQRREALGISQGALGRHIGLTFSQVQKYEKGSNRIGSGRLYLIAELLGVTVYYFFEGLDGKEPLTLCSQAYVGKREVNLSTLDAALCGIRDSATRQSILALVSTLVDAPGREAALNSRSG